MGTLSRVLPRTIAGQITSLVIVSLVLAQALTVAAILFFAREPSAVTSRAMTGARIATIARLANAAQSPAEVDSLVATARRAGIDVRHVSLDELEAEAGRPAGRPMATRILSRIIDDDSGMDVLKTAAPQGKAGGSIVIKFGEESALVFRSFPKSRFFKWLTVPLVLNLTIIAALVIVLSVYAGRWITAPLSSFAAAAHSFGRSPIDERALDEGGPREVAQVAQALNGMRTRIRALVDDRTRMLAAIGHDVRTPLTRLRLHAERLGDADARASMLREITMIDKLLGETLTYLRDDIGSERNALVDLPSLLQTICSEFADVGHRVSYRGPDRLAYSCRPNALARALRNLVENGVKYGSEVAVDLQTADDNSIHIEVADNGPGIPYSLREKAFEPFFKVDSARTASARTGFGLGLSIARDAVRGEGGEIYMLDRVPHGLTVRVVLPPRETLPARAADLAEVVTP
jgi:signal transduction histidine kinase